MHLFAAVPHQQVTASLTASRKQADAVPANIDLFDPEPFSYDPIDGEPVQEGHLANIWM